MESNLRINEDVVVEILCRCPFKDLGRFKCVSKTWCFLISHVCAPRMSDTIPILGLYFRELALSDHVPRSHLLLSSEYTPSEHTPSEHTLSNNKMMYDKMMFEYVPLSDLSPANQQPEGEVIDSSGGLLLSVRKSNCQYYVCNPLTKQSVEIPKACNQTSSSSVYCGLAFDPCESLHFKIVRFLSSPSKPTLLDIYFSNIGKWVRPVLQLDHHIYQPSSIYLKGVMYRLAYSNELLCLDLNTVNMHFNVLPKLQNSRGVGSLGVRMGSLSYVKICRSCKIYIWSLEGNSKAGSEWCFKYIVSTFDIFGQVLQIFKHPLKGSYHYWLEPYAFHPNSDVIFLGTPRMIFSYDLCSKSLKKVFGSEDSMRCYHPYLLVHGCLSSFKNDGLTQSASSKISNYQVACPISGGGGGGTTVYM